MKLRLLTIFFFALFTSLATSLSCPGIVDRQIATSGETVLISGSITSTRTLTKDTTYLLVGQVLIYPDASLIVRPGVKILGDVKSKGTLIALPGSKIYLNGTVEDPIIMTSSRPAFQKKPGDWGGVLILGNAPNNISDNALSKAKIGTHGGPNAIDTSGILSYVRVEYAGAEINGERLAGFGFSSVGAGTSVSNLQAHRCASDGFRFVGGTLNAKYLVSTGNQDDGFEMSNSWIGKGQFWICVQSKSTGSHGYELINNLETPTNPVQIGASLYLTSPVIYNATLVGKGSVDEDGPLDETDGIAARKNTQGYFYNHAIINFPGVGISIDEETQAQLFSNLLTIRNSLFYIKSDEDDNGSQNYGAVWTGPDAKRDKLEFNGYASDWNNLVLNPMLPIDFLNPLPGFPPNIAPDPKDEASPLLSSSLIKTPKDPDIRYPKESTDFFDETATFIGAIGKDKAWIHEKWISWR